MNIPLTWVDVLFAAGVALTVTSMYQFFQKIFHLQFSSGTVFEFNPRNMEEMLARCNELFPIDFFRFNDTTFRRGMQVKLVLMGQGEFVGKFIGANERDMVCVVSNNKMVAKEIHTITDMYPVEHSNRGE